MHRTRYASLISEIVDLLACPGSPEPAPRDRARPHEPLTGGETRVLRYLPTHLCAPDIARELELSVSTVKTHMRHLYQKLGAHSRREAVERARVFGLLALRLSATSTGAPAHSADPRQLDHDELRKQQRIDDQCHHQVVAYRQACRGYRVWVVPPLPRAGPTVPP